MRTYGSIGRTLPFMLEEGVYINILEENKEEREGASEGTVGSLDSLDKIEKLFWIILPITPQTIIKITNTKDERSNNTFCARTMPCMF